MTKEQRPTKEETINFSSGVFIGDRGNHQVNYVTKEAQKALKELKKDLADFGEGLLDDDVDCEGFDIYSSAMELVNALEENKDPLVNQTIQETPVSSIVDHTIYSPQNLFTTMEEQKEDWQEPTKIGLEEYLQKEKYKSQTVKDEIFWFQLGHITYNIPYKELDKYADIKGQEQIKKQKADDV